MALPANAECGCIRQVRPAGISGRCGRQAYPAGAAGRCGRQVRNVQPDHRRTPWRRHDPACRAAAARLGPAPGGPKVRPDACSKRISRGFVPRPTQCVRFFTQDHMEIMCGGWQNPGDVAKTVATTPRIGRCLDRSDNHAAGHGPLGRRDPTTQNNKDPACRKPS
jgi:hypothetical protein